MLKKNNRLKSHKAFSATYNNKHIYSDDLLILYVGKLKDKTKQDCPMRVGFVVSKKVHKRAVVRNKIKRFLRNDLRLFIKNKNFEIMNEYLSFIFIAKARAATSSHIEITKSIENLLFQLTNKNIY